MVMMKNNEKNLGLARRILPFCAVTNTSRENADDVHRVFTNFITAWTTHVRRAL